MLTFEEKHNRDMKALCQEKKAKNDLIKKGFLAKKKAAEAMIYGKWPT